MKAFVLLEVTLEEIDSMEEMVGTELCRKNAYVASVSSSDYGKIILTNCQYLAKNHKDSGRKVKIIDFNQFNNLSI
jgi:hypothetical protein